MMLIEDCVGIDLQQLHVLEAYKKVSRSCVIWKDLAGLAVKTVHKANSVRISSPRTFGKDYYEFIMNQCEFSLVVKLKIINTMLK